jgi:hypothetical protein
MNEWVSILERAVSAALEEKAKSPQKKNTDKTPAKPR